MRIKADFVTNSSSSCFIVYIPKSFQPTPEDIKSAIDDYNSGTEEIEIADSIKEILDGIEELKSGGCIFQSTYDYRDGVSIYSAIEHICERNAFGVQSHEIHGGDGCSFISGIDPKKIYDIDKRS